MHGAKSRVADGSGTTTSPWGGESDSSFVGVGIELRISARHLIGQPTRQRTMGSRDGKGEVSREEPERAVAPPMLSPPRLRHGESATMDQYQTAAGRHIVAAPNLTGDGYDPRQVGPSPRKEGTARNHQELHVRRRRLRRLALEGGVAPHERGRMGRRLGGVQERHVRAQSEVCSHGLGGGIFLREATFPSRTWCWLEWEWSRRRSTPCRWDIARPR